MKQRSFFWWLFAIALLLAGVGLTGLLLTMAFFPEFAWLRWVFGPLWVFGAPLLIGVTIAWVVRRIRLRLRAKAVDRPVNALAPSKGQRSPTQKGLTPVQIGACVGAAAVCLFLLAVRDLSRPIGTQDAIAGDPGSNVLLGVLSGVGAMIGMGVAALIGVVRRRKGNKNEAANRESAELG